MQYRKGSRFGHDTVVDGMLKDGLWDVYNDYAMGMCGELCSEQHTITREEQVYSIVATLICMTCLYNIISFASSLQFNEMVTVLWHKKLGAVKLPTSKNNHDS